MINLRLRHAGLAVAALLAACGDNAVAPTDDASPQPHFDAHVADPPDAAVDAGLIDAAHAAAIDASIDGPADAAIDAAPDARPDATPDAPPPPPDRDHDGTIDDLDCAPDDDHAWVLLALFPDGDHDHVGAGTPIATCTDGTAPDGTSILGTDCADNDDRSWQVLVYANVNRDRDQATRPEVGSVCSGASLVPPYFATATGNDGDDGDPDRWRFVVLYPDGDGDGVGAGHSQIPCLGAAIPDGLTIGGYDEDDGDPRVTEDPDDDEDELLDLYD